MSNDAKFMKDLLSKKRKLKECETMALTEECSAIIQKKLPPKLKDPGSFSIPIAIRNIEVGKALCDLGARINLMPFSICKSLEIRELKPTTVSLQLADRLIRRPDGVIEDVLVKIVKFIFPAVFLILNMEEDAEIPILLGRPFLATARAMIDVEQGKLMLRMNEETFTIDVFESMKHPSDGGDCFMESSPLELEKINEETELVDKEQEPVVEELEKKKDDLPLGTLKVELKEPPTNLKYASFGDKNTYPVIINVELTTMEEDKLLMVLKKYKAAIGWSFSYFKGINPSFCTHKILIENNVKPVRQPQRRLNQTMKKVVRKEVLVTGNSCVKVVTLNRPQKLNSLNHEMICQLKKNLELCENDSSVKLVILKGNGKAFCAGGDVVSVITSGLAGHWTYPASFYKKQLILDHLIASYKKPTVSLINGVVMGGGAGLSMNTRFRIVTEKAVFAMPEASIGLFSDVGASYFLSRLPGYFGEYLGLTGARLKGAEIAECGLATHFVTSTKLNSLENALEAVTSSNVSTIATMIETFTEKANAKEESSFRRLETINKCFSKGTVEEIIQSLENELEIGAELWITDALSYLRSSCPTSLKIFLKSIRKGRAQNIEQCLYRDYNIACHFFRRTITNDFYEGSRAKLFDKDNKPKWEPSKLELVNEEMVDQYFRNVNDEEWESLQFPDRSHSQIVSRL
ncbi:probable 3-hydroxyisobutyryl-CoA hydrolase 3 [Gastrolobium bilobum]|uniref:probable 3-hydroxyisobutyryl-CoA hydrolase 3 n=1 Tax=Gastrolobium bilobum TaxID=150636 RepID=UPI002AAF4D33|nr:probable 3-hydroxyisobutyryl-CoA hydrolase 3 [Gastrolobium bilobum]